MEPIGFLRDDYLAAHIAQHVIAPHANETPSISDMMLFDPDRFEPQDEDMEEFTVSGLLTVARTGGLEVVQEQSEKD